METPKKKFDFVVHRNCFNENVVVLDESKWLAMAQMRTLYPGANFSLVVGGRK